MATVIPSSSGEMPYSQASTSPPTQSPVERSDYDSDTPRMQSSRSPSNASSDFPLLPDVQARTPRSHAVAPNFVSSPLNPNAPVHPSGPPSLFAGSQRQSMVFNRVPSEESQALSSHRSSHPNRSSMILYRVADEDEQRALSPPVVTRHSVMSSSAESAFSVSYDSKYPFGAHTPNKLIPFPFDPSTHITTPEDDDALHDPSVESSLDGSSGIAIRGFVNIGVLIVVILALLCLFIFYPVWHYVVQGNSTVP